MADGGDTARMIVDALAYALDVDLTKLEVLAADGVVTLRGFVFGDDERCDVEAIARQIPGVRRVVNELVVMKVPCD